MRNPSCSCGSGRAISTSTGKAERTAVSYARQSGKFYNGTCYEASPRTQQRVLVLSHSQVVFDPIVDELPRTIEGYASVITFKRIIKFL